MIANKVAIAIMILIITIISTYILIQHKLAQQHSKLLTLFTLPLNNTYWSEARQIIKESQNEENILNHVVEITKTKYHRWKAELTSSFPFSTKNGQKIRKILRTQWMNTFGVIKNDTIFHSFYVTTLEDFNLFITDVTAHIHAACQNISDIIESIGAFNIPQKTNDFISIIEFRNKIQIADTYIQNLDDIIFVNYFGINLEKFKNKTLKQLQKIKSTFQSEKGYCAVESNEEAKNDVSTVYSEEEKYDVDEEEKYSIMEAIKITFADLHDKNPMTNILNIADAFHPDSLKGLDITNIQKHECNQILNSLLKKYNNNKKSTDQTHYLVSKAVAQICNELKHKL
eukprot:348719_1